MNKGFCILAENNYKTDYVKQAYALTLSIHKHNKENRNNLTFEFQIYNNFKNKFYFISDSKMGA